MMRGASPLPSIWPGTGTRVDLHLHSRASTDTGNWFLKQALLPESYTEPEVAYRTAKRRGMDFVTLTDHNTLAGVMEIAHHDDVFVSVEVTTQFPGEQTPLHVLVWGLNEAQWSDIDAIRANVYDVVDCVNAAGLTHALAHPLQRLGAELTVEHLEICLLLFPIWEGLNGSRGRPGNEIARRIAAAASPEFLAKLADKHDLAVHGDGRRGLTGGSDDHALLGAAGAWTETPLAGTARDMLSFVRAGRCLPCGDDGGATALAHAIVSLGLTSHAKRGSTALPGPLRDLVANLTGQALPSAPARDANSFSALQDMLARRMRGDRRLRARYWRAMRQPDSAERAQTVLREATGWLHGALVGACLGGTDDARLGGIERAAGLATAGLVAAPYLASAAYHASESRFANDIGAQFFVTPLIESRAPRVAVFTDTFDELNGVAGTMRRLAAFAETTPDARLTIVACRDGEQGEHLVSLPTVSSVPVPGYGDHSWRLGIPSVLDVLSLAEDRGIELVHVATPGPTGLVGLLVGKILGVPVVTTHHTELARYAMLLTEDRLALELTRLALRWLYGQAERIYVPSNAAAAGLAEHGVDGPRIGRFGRGIDTRQFSPERRGFLARRRLGGDAGAVVALYVGRISREKGVFALAKAFRQAARSRPEFRLAIVGEGPDRERLERALAGTNTRFLGPLTGNALGAAYASADVFCLPSETETYGQVVGEASASGLPVVTTDRGGACELVTDGVTGLVARGGDVLHLTQCLATLCDDRARRERMGAAGRAAMCARPSWDDVFATLVDDYRGLCRRTASPASASMSTAAIG